MQPQITRVAIAYQQHGRLPAWQVDYQLAGVSLALTVPRAQDAIEARQLAEKLLRLPVTQFKRPAVV